MPACFRGVCILSIALQGREIKVRKAFIERCEETGECGGRKDSRSLGEDCGGSDIVLHPWRVLNNRKETFEPFSATNRGHGGCPGMEVLWDRSVVFERFSFKQAS